MGAKSLDVDVILRQDGRHVCVYGQSDVREAAAAIKVLCKRGPKHSFGNFVYCANADWAARVLAFHGFTVAVEAGEGDRSWFKSWKTTERTDP